MKIKTQNFINLFVDQMLQWINDTIFSRGTPSEKSFNLLISILFILQFSLFNLQCKKPTPPDIDDTPKPGKRDYTWTIDTLAYPGSFQTLMRDIWASSPTNVYVVGHNDQGGQGTMFRFDGNRWRAVDLGSIIIGGISLSAIYGFGPNDVYAVGERIYDNPAPPPNFLDSSLIIHFDGISWKDISPTSDNLLLSVWISSPKDIWACGRGGLIFYFNGSKWKKYEMGKEYFFSSIVGISLTEIYTIGHVSDFVAPIDSSGYFLFKFEGDHWQKVDSVMNLPDSPPARFGQRLLSFNGSLYSSASNVYRYWGGVWQKFFEGPVTTIYIFNSANMFAVGKSIYHFNGQDWYEYNQFRSSEWLYQDCYTDGNEVFVLSSNGFKSFILHGK